MQDFILFAVLPLLVMFAAYSRLRRRIQSLEARIEALNLASRKLREANGRLHEELKRIECRSESQGLLDRERNPSPPDSEEPAEPEEPPVRRVIPDEPEGPPPLPSFRAAAPENPEPAADVPPRPAPRWESVEPAEFSHAAGPSLFSNIPWREILGRMHLLPPTKSESGETAETQLAAWWVIRIGLVLLIIAAVFFGIHVSRHTPAWLRVLTLAAVSLGTVGLGTRMSGTLESFGRAIIGGGFALLYFTAFAAFALPATKIIESPAIGALAQFAALAVAILWSLWKRDQTVATLTLFLGLVSCGFSHSHDLDRFATVGLLLLAATGAFLFATRGWLAPFLTALVGAWAGFGLFALLDRLRTDSPAFPGFMATLVALTVVFEAGNLLCAARGRHVSADRLRRWLILGSTSAAALLGYAITRLSYPEQLPTFYFILSVVYFAFTAIHHYRTTDRVVTETLFLKSSALLCLGFAAAFSGPVRWLAIAFQAFALLWTARRSGSRWIAAGFALVLAASIGWFWRDLALDPPADWRWFDPFRIAGGFYLVFLTVLLALHARWFPLGIGGSDGTHESQARALRLAGSLIVGCSALALSLNPPARGHSDPVWFLFALSVLIGLPGPIMRSAVPIIAATLPLGSCYIAYAVLPPAASQSAAALLLGVTLIMVAFGASGAVRRHWPETLTGGSMIREGTLLLGLATLLPFSIALCRMFALSGNAGIGGFTLFPLLACTALWRRQQTMGNGQRARLSIGFQLTTGVLVVLGGSFTCGSSAYFPAALAVAGLPLLATAKRVRIWNVVIAAAFPILAGFFLLWLRLIRVQPGEMLHDSINLAVLLAISTSLSFLLWKKVRTAILRKASLRGDALLHCLGIVSLHLFFQKHLGEGPDFFAAALLGLSLFAASRRFPFRVLGAVSWLPVALACSSGILAGNWQGLDDSETWFLAAGTLVLAHLVTAGHLERIHPSPRTDFLEGKFGFGPPHFASFIAVLAWTLIALAVTMAPWQAAALTGVALLCSALWRWRIIPVIGHLGLGPLTLAFCFAAALTVAANDAPHPAAWMLTTLALTAAGIAANGMILASAVRHILGGRITAGSLLPWLHACGTLLIAFAACTPDRLVSDNLTAVFWGFSAITLFVCGLLAGLRAYRLAGLAGLVLCVGHIFIWDIQDTFYRIIAFFVIGLVMMVIGFLYHRFRDRISAFD